jgi:hypothetical protein
MVEDEVGLDRAISGPRVTKSMVFRILGATIACTLSHENSTTFQAGLVGALVGAGIPEHEAKYDQDEFEAERVIVTAAA